MIIELGNYNSARILIGIEHRVARYPYAIRMGQSAFVSRAAVRMEVEERDANRAQGRYKWGPSREWHRDAAETPRSNQRSISTQ